MQGAGVWGWRTHKGLEKTFPFGCAALPRGAPDARFVTFTDPWVMSASSRHPEAAWTFLKLLISRPIQRMHMEIAGAPPARLSLLPEFYQHYPGISPAEMKTCFLGAIAYGQESPSHLLVEFDKIEYALDKALEPILHGQQPAAAVLPEADAQIERLLQDIHGRWKGNKGKRGKMMK